MIHRMSQSQEKQEWDYLNQLVYAIKIEMEPSIPT